MSQRKRPKRVKSDSAWIRRQMTLTGTLARMGLADEPFKRPLPARRRKGGAL